MKIFYIRPGPLLHLSTNQHRMRHSANFLLCLLLILLVVYFLMQEVDQVSSFSISALLLPAKYDLHRTAARVQMLDAHREARSVLHLPMWSPIIEDVLIGYSAHWDTRTTHEMMPPFVRILATALNPEKIDDLLIHAISCRFWHESGSSSVVKGIVTKHASADRSRDALFILCPADDIRQRFTSLPQSVSVQCPACNGPWVFDVSTDNQPL